MNHAEVIKHMADHGLESVEGRNTGGGWFAATEMVNPISRQYIEWRIKPEPVVTRLLGYKRLGGRWSELTRTPGPFDTHYIDIDQDGNVLTPKLMEIEK